MNHLLNQALQHHKSGRLIEAESIYREILAVSPRDADSLHLLGLIAYEWGNFDAAAELMRMAIAIHANGASYHSNLGNVLEAQGKPEEAIAEYRMALTIKPNLPEIHINLGNVLQAQEAFDEAVLSYQSALKLQPRSVEALYNLGNARQVQGRFADAVRCFEQALAINPGHPKAHHNLGRVLEDLGRPDEAYAQFQRAVSLEPDNPEIGFNAALAQLSRGDFSSGWVNYEQRWRSSDHDTSMRDYPPPLWTGEELGSGRLLIWGEQGVGDEIMFAGMIPELVQRGVDCVLDCDVRLQPLFARSFPGIHVVSGYHRDGDLKEDFAAHLPCGSLPRIFRTSQAAFAAAPSPYLVPDPERLCRFRSDYCDGRMLVGLAWRTEARKTGRRRSIDLSDLEPLFARSDVRWVSLQYGELDALRDEAENAGVPIHFDTSVDQLSDIDTFAAQVAAMDMVITIDNSTAHIAGGLGIPVWLMLPFHPDWRWLVQGERSLWYPSMRLFRQPRLGDWISVVQNVTRELDRGVTHSAGIKFLQLGLNKFSVEADGFAGTGGRPEMSNSISGVYLDPSTELPGQTQIPTTTGTTATQSVDTVNDVITLSSATTVQKLNEQGEAAEQIAQSLGISLTTVELDLGVAPTIDVPAGSGGVSAFRAGSASTSSDSGTSAASGAGATTSTHVSTGGSSAPASNSGSTSGATPAVSSDGAAAAGAGSSAASSKGTSSAPATEPVSVAAVAQVAATPIPRNPFA
jgi:Flp pilus assembly protein TadD